MAIPTFESEAEWEEHRAAVVASLYPEGFLETQLAERVALCLWRLKRVARAEGEAITVSQESLEDDCRERFRYQVSKPNDPEEVRRSATSAKERLRVFERLPKLPDAATVATNEALILLDAVAELVKDEHFDYEEFDVPGVPAEAFDEDSGFDGWTAGLVRQCLGALAAVDGRSAEALLDAVTWRARAAVYKADEEMKQVSAALDKMSRQRLLPNEATLIKLSRYEASLERSLYKALHQLERLQAARTGQPVEPPIAIDVDVAVT